MLGFELLPKFLETMLYFLLRIKGLVGVLIYYIKLVFGTSCQLQVLSLKLSESPLEEHLCLIRHGVAFGPSDLASQATLSDRLLRDNVDVDDNVLDSERDHDIAHGVSGHGIKSKGCKAHQAVCH